MIEKGLNNLKAYSILCWLLLFLFSMNSLNAQTENNASQNNSYYYNVHDNILANKNLKDNFSNIFKCNFKHCEVYTGSKLYNMSSLRDSLLNKNLKDTITKNIKIDTTNKKKESIEKFKMKKSPWLAVGLSAIFPGLGQIYNESYWKLPIVAFFTGLLGYEIIWNNSKFLDYRDKYAATQSTINPEGDTRFRDLREFYRDQRDQNLLYFGIFYLINMADAYVDAHLYDFNVNDKINIGLFRHGKIANLKITF